MWTPAVHHSASLRLCKQTQATSSLPPCGWGACLCPGQGMAEWLLCRFPWVFLLQLKSKVWGEFLTLSIVAVHQNLCPGSTPTVDSSLCYTFALWLPVGLQFQVEHRLPYVTCQKSPSQCRQEPSHLSQLSLSWSTHLLRPLVYVTLSQQYRHGSWGGSFKVLYFILHLESILMLKLFHVWPVGTFKLTPVLCHASLVLFSSVLFSDQTKDLHLSLNSLLPGPHSTLLSRGSTSFQWGVLWNKHVGISYRVLLGGIFVLP